MVYIVQVVLLIIVLFSSWMAKRQFRKAIEQGKFDFGMHILEPLTGDKAVRMAKRGLLISQIAPWAYIGAIVLYDLL